MDRPGPDQLASKPDELALRSWSWIEPGWNAIQKGEHEIGIELLSNALHRHPNDLLLQRAVNILAPELLKQGHLSRAGAPWGSRIAVLLPGELRCLQETLPLFREVAYHADIFICTSKPFEHTAKKLRSQLTVVNSEPELPMGSMQQWHKLSVCLKMLRQHELRHKQRYTHILKLRTDFHHVQPRNLLRELVKADGIICASDKVFGGRRELMLLFEGFYAAIQGWYDGQEQRYWPINLTQILRSDDSSKWYGMAFPQELVGQPASVSELRDVLASGGEGLGSALQRWRPPENADVKQMYMQQLHRLFQGHPRFASEVCFARFLNFNGIPAHCSPGMLGFLRSDRRA